MARTCTPVITGEIPRGKKRPRGRHRRRSAQYLDITVPASRCCGKTFASDTYRAAAFSVACFQSGCVSRLLADASPRSGVLLESKEVGPWLEG